MEFNDILDDYQNIVNYEIDDIDNAVHLKNGKSINFIHFNICGLGCHYDELVALLELSKIDFEVIILSETHTIYDIHDFKLTGYDIFFNDSQINSYDGMVILVKSYLNPTGKILQYGHSKFLRITFSKNQKIFSVIGTYNSPSLNRDQFIINLNSLLSSNYLNNDFEIFCGDININIFGTDSTCQDYLNCLYEFGYRKQIYSITRPRSGTCLDHFFLKSKNNNIMTKPTVLKNYMTDHFPIILNIDINNKSHPLNNSYNIKKINYKNIENKINRENWNDVTTCQNPNLAVNMFINRMTNLIDDSTEFKTFNKKRQKKSWVTQGIILSIKTRDRLKKATLSSPQNNEIIQNYKTYRNLLTKIIKNAKFTYFKNKLNNVKNDMKGTWEVIREVTNEPKCSDNIKYIYEKGEKITDNQKISNVFLDYYVNMGKNLSKKIKTNHFKFQTKLSPSSIFLAPIEYSELFNQIQSLKNRASSALDNISTKILKSNSLALSKPLLHIINLILDQGIYPDILKKSIITPIFKSGDKDKKENYRPIAVTSTLNKIFEKCLKMRLCGFLEKKGLLSATQFGFRSGMGTDNALQGVTDFVNKNFNEGYKTIGIFIDLARAFDTVNHSLLLQKLWNLGVRGKANDLFKSYLKNRIQQVKINGEFSEEGEVNIGVPQGTVLGPVLFLVYLNDLMSILPTNDCICICFADDSVILIKAKSSWKELHELSEHYISIVKLWMDQNRLTLNENKTLYIPFSLKNVDRLNLPRLKIHTLECLQKTGSCSCHPSINSQRNCKYLGVYIDSNLKYDSHIDYIVKKVRKTIYKFYQLREFMPLKLIKIVYHSLVESVLRYGITVWGSTYSNVLNNIEILQKCLIKIIYKKPKRHPTDLIFRDSGLLTIKQIYVGSVIRFMKKFNTYKDNISHSITTRLITSESVVTPGSSLSTTQRHVSFMGPRIYNILPLKIKTKRQFYMKKVNEWIKNNWNNIKRKICIL